MLYSELYRQKLVDNSSALAAIGGARPATGSGSGSCAGPPHRLVEASLTGALQLELAQDADRGEQRRSKLGRGRNWGSSPDFLGTARSTGVRDRPMETSTEGRG